MPCMFLHAPQDADLLMLALLLHDPRVTILRESFAEHPGELKAKALASLDAAKHAAKNGGAHALQYNGQEVQGVVHADGHTHKVRLWLVYILACLYLPVLAV